MLDPGGQSQSAVQEYAQDMNMWARESLDEFENIWNQQQEVDEQMSLAYQETKQDWQLQRVKKKESRKRRIDDNHTQMMLSMKEHEEDQAKERAATIAHRQETEKAQRLAFAKLEETKQTRKATARAEAEGENNRRLAKLRAQNEQAEKELETGKYCFDQKIDWRPVSLTQSLSPLDFKRLSRCGDRSKLQTVT